MHEEEAEDDERVTVSMELAGPYDDVVSKLRTTADAGADLGRLTEDLSVLLDTVVRLDGGTRSAIAEALPDEMAADYDGQAVVEVCQVLERYDLVVLDGNTWNPGPALGDRDATPE